MKSNTHICPSLESVTKKHHQSPNSEKTEDLLGILFQTHPSLPSYGWYFFQHLVEMRVSMAMEDHTTPSAAKTATNLVLRASKLGWKTWKRGRKRGNCQCDCKCAYSTMIFILV